MPAWNPQHYRYEGIRHGVAADVINSAIHRIENIHRVHPRLPPILTLRHLSVLSDIPYGYLRNIVRRKAGRYKRVLFKKKVPGRSRYREIHIPEACLHKVQNWISERILKNTKAHPASFAFHPGSQPVFAAARHCGCKWLLKIDLEDFFHSISERKVYFAFADLGYAPLLSFEMARLTTMISLEDWGAAPSYSKWTAIPSYEHSKEGFLPQGSPTSPMLSNLIMKVVDGKLEVMAKEHGFKYTRYADDLAFSTSDNLNIQNLKLFKKKVLLTLTTAGFKQNQRKTMIRGPGARRIVLGILVDGDVPRLPKEYKDGLRQHLYYLKSSEHGPSKHAEGRNMSISTLYHHIRGKIAWAERVEPDFGRSCLVEFQSVGWPSLDIDHY